MKIVIIIVCIACFFALIDYIRIKGDKKPIFSFRVITIADGGEEGSDVYLGLGYKIYSYSNSERTSKKYEMVSIWAKFKNPNHTFPLIGKIIKIEENYYCLEVTMPEQKLYYKIQKMTDKEFKIKDEIVVVCVGNGMNDINEKDVIVPVNIMDYRTI